MRRNKYKIYGKVSLLSMSLPAIIFKISSTITLTEKPLPCLISANGASVTILSRNSNWDTALPLLTHWHKKPCEKDIKKNFCSRPDYATKKKMAVYATVFGDV